MGQGAIGLVGLRLKIIQGDAQFLQRIQRRKGASEHAARNEGCVQQLRTRDPMTASEAFQVPGVVVQLQRDRHQGPRRGQQSGDRFMQQLIQNNGIQ